MKIITALFVLIVVAVLCLIAGLRGQLALPSAVPVYEAVMNIGKDPIPVHVESPRSDRTLGYLSPKDHLLLRYEGSQGQWKYVTFQGAQASLRTGELVKGKVIYNRLFVPKSLYEDLLNNLRLEWLVGGSLLWFLVAHWRLRSRYTRLQHQVARRSSVENDNNRLRQELEARDRLHAEAQCAFNSVKQDLCNQVTDRNHQLSSLKNAFMIEKQRALDAKFEAESRNRMHQVELGEMSSSYERLQQDWDKFKSEMRVFNVNVDDKRYENILKGREFELFVAGSLARHQRFKILEWTPDKGSLAGIKAVADGNPDLVVENAKGQQFAVECKYRSKAYFRSVNRNPELDWAKEYQRKRYVGFQRDRQIPVFLAFGFTGEPSKPDMNYLVRLDKLTDISREDAWRSDINCVASEKELVDDFVANGDFCGALMRYASGGQPGRINGGQQSNVHDAPS